MKNMEFVLISAGTFLMGSPMNEPGRNKDELLHEATITKPYYLQTTPVTQGQWRSVMGNNPSFFSSCGDDCPVEQVSWNDAQAFISRLNEKEGTSNYRLPTEAEWEYAARAGTTGAYCFGDSKSNLGNYAWYGSNFEGKIHPVGRKSPNAWGLYDMHGNVWEWCKDWYGPYESTPGVDPKGPDKGDYCVLRGGSWRNHAELCRLAARNGDRPAARYNDVGFRIVNGGK